MSGSDSDATVAELAKDLMRLRRAEMDANDAATSAHCKRFVAEKRLMKLVETGVLDDLPTPILEAAS